MPATRPPLGGTPGPRKEGPPDNSPGSEAGIKGERWALDGFLEEKPPDPYANLTESDSLEQCHPKDHRKQSDEFQRPRIEPLESEWV